MLSPAVEVELGAEREVDLPGAHVASEILEEGVAKRVRGVGCGGKGGDERFESGEGVCGEAPRMLVLIVGAEGREGG